MRSEQRGDIWVRFDQFRLSFDTFVGKKVNSSHRKFKSMTWLSPQKKIVKVKSFTLKKSQWLDLTFVLWKRKVKVMTLWLAAQVWINYLLHLKINTMVLSPLLAKNQIGPIRPRNSGVHWSIRISKMVPIMCPFDWTFHVSYPKKSYNTFY